MYNIKFECSKEVQVSDFLSRQPLSEAELSSSYAVTMNTPLILNEQVQDHSNQDKLYQLIYDWISDGWPKTIPGIYNGTELEAFKKVDF